MPSEPAPGRRFTFPPHVRLRTRPEFLAVYEKRVSRRVGGLVIFVAPNGRDFVRLGLSIPKKVGNAVKRNQVRRCLREAFRHVRHDLPAGYDVVINVHPHDPVRPHAYATMIADAVRSLHRRWTRSDRQNDPGEEQ